MGKLVMIVLMVKSFIFYFNYSIFTPFAANCLYTQESDLLCPTPMLLELLLNTNFGLFLLMA
jgi:hypothetical protein